MVDESTFVGAAMLAGTLAVVHAALTWSPTAAARFLVVTLALAFVGELLAVRAGLLVHHTRPQVLGIPLAALAGWVAAIYLWYRLALLVVPPGAAASLVAATGATLVDAALDHRGVAAGLWRYPEAWLSRPRFRGVPWWNAVGWFALTALVTSLAP